MRGAAPISLKRYENAIDDFTEVIDLSAPEARAYYNRGVAYRSAGRFEDAIEDFGRYIESYPDNASTYVHRGDCLRGMEEPEVECAAAQDYAHALELDSDNAWAHFGLGEVQRSLQMYKDALKEYERAGELWVATGTEKAIELQEELTSTGVDSFLAAESYAELKHAAFWNPAMLGLDFIASLKQIDCEELSRDVQQTMELNYP